MRPTKPNRVPEVLSKLSRVRGESRSSLLARAEKAEQERDQALEKARDRESARVIETDRADGISETLQEARRHIDQLEEKYTAARISLHLAEQSYEREQRVVVEISELKAAQRLRPMDEALEKNGEYILIVHEAIYIGRPEVVGEWIEEGHPCGWLPLPDQDEKDAS